MSRPPASLLIRLNQNKYLWIAGLVAISVASLFAIFTQHAWEDYYITYRSSRNLAEGNGLVFNLGERVHTFTSPLGVLLPALASFVTGTTNDVAALWVFRGLSIGAFAGAMAVLVAIGCRSSFSVTGMIAMTALVALDAKSIDFTINGMETGVLILFLSYTLWALLSGPEKWKHLGMAWAGLMWTRPDSFIYITILATAAWVFRIGLSSVSRNQILICFLKAGLVTTALYLPWFLGAWLYYGSPIPHTIIAKSGLNSSPTWLQVLDNAWRIPYTVWGVESSATAAFLPSYFQLGGWPASLLIGARVMAGVTSMLWILPRMSSLVRLGSFGFFGVHLYLSTVPYFPFPWYLPAGAPMAAIAWGGLLTQLTSRSGSVRWKDNVRGLVVAVVVVGVAVQSWVTFQSARQIKAQQQWIETGTRREIGLYLRSQAKPEDTVFMEPLGYIGYFSGLRTYDFPGMSSPETVAARKLVGQGWRELLGYLRPNWVVLRPHELESIQRNVKWRISRFYDQVAEFDHRAEVSELNVYGLSYLQHDATFLVFRRKPDNRTEIGDVIAISDFGSQRSGIEGMDVIMIHASGEAFIQIPSGSTHLKMKFGFMPGAHEGIDPTDGARFGFEVRDGVNIHPISLVDVDPNAGAEQRSPQVLDVALPPDLSPDARLRVVIDAVSSTQQDWTYVTQPEFSP